MANPALAVCDPVAASLCCPVPRVPGAGAHSRLSMAGSADKGIPNGLPVDEWGIRVEGCAPVGASMSRGGATNSPAAVYALTKYIDWMKKYAPPEATGMPSRSAASRKRAWWPLM